ncbi:phospholysine phosphohistidine inorganic pyrophosphate phosphatase isoform X5 [Notamacropus eugenii]|uniref:phospholysine phosphohistidine inorganic pyrophosphate phosphatase isoform X5 n=1 Tax=Notamacropus eugenii TaxID=9315 RepID=UPI003B6831CF
MHGSAHGTLWEPHRYPSALGPFLRFTWQEAEAQSRSGVMLLVRERVGGRWASPARIGDGSGAGTWWWGSSEQRDRVQITPAAPPPPPPPSSLPLPTTTPRRLCSRLAAPGPSLRTTSPRSLYSSHVPRKASLASGATRAMAAAVAAWAQRLAGVRGVLLDVSGVLYDSGDGGGTAIPGSVEAVARRYYKETEGLMLDVGPYMKALEYACDIQAEVVGKPAPEFFQAALKEMGVEAHEAIMIGDDIVNDVGGAQRCGMRALQVRTGKFRSLCLSLSGPPDTCLVPSLTCSGSVFLGLDAPYWFPASTRWCQRALCTPAECQFPRKLRFSLLLSLPVLEEAWLSQDAHSRSSWDRVLPQALASSQSGHW